MWFDVIASTSAEVGDAVGSGEDDVPGLRWWEGKMSELYPPEQLFKRTELMIRRNT